MRATPVYRHRLGPLLSAYLDGELPTSAAIAIGAHLGDCPSCSEDLAALGRVKVGLRALRGPALEGDRRAALVGRFRARSGAATA